MPIHNAILCQNLIISLCYCMFKLLRVFLSITNTLIKRYMKTLAILLISNLGVELEICFGSTDTFLKQLLYIPKFFRGVVLLPPPATV